MRISKKQIAQDKRINYKHDQITVPYKIEPNTSGGKFVGNRGIINKDRQKNSVNVYTKSQIDMTPIKYPEQVTIKPVVEVPEPTMIVEPIEEPASITAIPKSPFSKKRSKLIRDVNYLQVVTKVVTAEFKDSTINLKQQQL